MSGLIGKKVRVIYTNSIDERKYIGKEGIVVDCDKNIRGLENPMWVDVSFPDGIQVFYYECEGFDKEVVVIEEGEETMNTTNNLLQQILSELKQQNERAECIEKANECTLADWCTDGKPVDFHKPTVEASKEYTLDLIEDEAVVLRSLLGNCEERGTYNLYEKLGQLVGNKEYKVLVDDKPCNCIRIAR